MAPIKVGFIGLGANGWARGAHTPYLKSGGKYQIVAVQNTSVESARKTIELEGLPAETKAYGSPDDIANDPDVELVVVSVRVDRHFAALAPSLKAGKDVVVEWPLAKSAAEARELLRLKNEGGVKRAEVVLQARRQPIIHKLKALIAEGAIGKVLSSTWSSYGGLGGPVSPQGLKYLGDKEVGGNLVTIHLGHAMDYVQFVLGYGVENPHALLRTRRETTNLLNDDGSVAEESIPKTADDTIFVSGELGSDKIPTSFQLFGGDAFPGTDVLDWRIHGMNGTIRVTASGPFLQIGYPDQKIEVHDLATGKVQNVEIPRDEFDEMATPDELPHGMYSRDFGFKAIGRFYKHLATGAESCTWEDAVERHELIEELYRQNGYTEV